MTTSAMICFAVLLLLYSGPLITLQQDQILTNCNPSVGNYTPDGQYEANLRNTLLPSLASNAATVNYSNYYSTVVGQGTNQIYGFAQCMSASTVDDCSACLNRSLTEITDLCPNRVRADVRYERCIIRYSNSSLLSTIDTSIFVFGENPNNATDPTLFRQQLGNLMRNLSSQAARLPSRLGAGMITFTDVQTIYGMTECTRDLSGSDCFRCLDSLIQRLSSRASGRLYYTTCSLRYQTDAFYPADGLTPPPPPDPSTTPPPDPVNTPPPDPSTPNEEENSSSNSNRTRDIIIGVVLGVAFMILCAWCLVRRKRKGRLLVATEIDESKRLLFDLNEIREATNDFAETNKLGQGGFGSVYKGTLRDGRQIAVKRLVANSSQGLSELKNEVASLARLQHRNLVKLHGCCLEDEEKILVYEFVPNSSLEKFLFDPVKRRDLEWNSRLKIIGGIARGLLYLHEDSRLRIIHRDLKASNILLDEEMNAKISDFGLAKIFESDQTQGNTSRIAGTFGYMAPEYVMHGKFSTKSDVFSFGVLIMEIVTGQKGSGVSESGDSRDLTSYVWRHWTGGSILEVIDRSLDGYSVNELVRCVHIGLLCVQDDAAERPTMSNVVLMLSSQSFTLPAPSPPPFCSFRSDKGYSYYYQSETNSTTLVKSANGA